MANVNFDGNVANPEIRPTNSGKSYLRFSVAESHRRKNSRTDQYEDSGTTWWRVQFWGNKLFTPEALHEAISGGKVAVMVSGRTETREYEKDGEKREAFEVTADRVGVMPKGGQPTSGGYGSQRPQEAPRGAQQGFGGSQGGWGSQDAYDNDQAPF